MQKWMTLDHFQPRMVLGKNIFDKGDYFHFYYPKAKHMAVINPGMLFFADREMRNRIIFSAIEYCDEPRMFSPSFHSYWYGRCLSKKEKENLIKKNPVLFERCIAQAEIHIKQAEKDAETARKLTTAGLYSRTINIKHSSDKELKDLKKEINEELKRRKNNELQR